jgi:hypothetical protein
MTDSNWESYRLLVADIDRYRDWPIKLLTFTSALHFAVMAAIAVKELTLACRTAVAVSMLLALLYGFTLYYFAKCHLRYRQLRNVQVRLNRLLKLEEVSVSTEKVFPGEWFSERPVSLKEGFWGWGFYACYATVLFGLSIILVWQLGFAWSK